jgi:hypothetical protein
MNDAGNDLAKLEHDPFWQLTAERRGELVVIMRGHEGAPFEKGFYTNNGALANVVIAGSWLRDQFSSGNLRLLRRSIPTDNNDQLFSESFRSRPSAARPVSISGFRLSASESEYIRLGCRSIQANLYANLSLPDRICHWEHRY